MFTKLLGSILLTSPEITTESKEAAIQLKNHKECNSLESLVRISEISRKSYDVIHKRLTRINLHAVEKEISLAKHAVSASMDDDFV